MYLLHIGSFFLFHTVSSDWSRAPRICLLMSRFDDNVRHRLKTIADADAIIVLKDGAVAEMGKHDELLALGGVYEALWHEQSTSYNSMSET